MRKKILVLSTIFTLSLGLVGFKHRPRELKLGNYQQLRPRQACLREECRQEPFRERQGLRLERRRSNPNCRWR